MDFEAMCVSNQRGAVLIFSLIMLLLLTLASVSMIQQNKQELAMTGNTLEQTMSLARVETELKLAEQEIDTARLDPANPDNRKCNSSPESQVSENWGFSNPQATVAAVYCLPTARETDLAKCPIGTTETDPDTGVVYCLKYTTEEQCTLADRDLDPVPLKCECYKNMGTEIYTIRWSSIAGSNYGAQRTVESKYAVDCSGGQF